MMENSVWYKNIENQIIEQKEKLYKRDYRFFHVDTFLLLSKKIDEFSHSCHECKELKATSEYIAANLFNLINDNSLARKSYEEKLEQIRKHLRKTHGILPKEYNTSFFSLIGLVIGLLLGFLVFLFNNEWLRGGLLIGSAVGLLVGRIYGRILDGKLIKDGKVLK
jgi:hypothetical protein